MIIKENVRLNDYTTIKMGGLAKKMYIPTNEDEIIDVITRLSPKYYIGGGSNLLINDSVYDIVVNLREFNKNIEHIGNGEYIVGASLRLQNLIKSINNDGYGGIEYLFSVPGLVGGAVVMNAGRAKQYNKCISDYILAVKVFHNGQVIWLSKDECDFSHRHSIFKQSDYLVLAVRMQFSEIEPTESESLRQNRIEYCKQFQDNSKPNFGSVFSESNSLIMKLMQKKLFGKKGNMMFSSKTPNWLLNCGGSFDDAIFLIDRVEKMHKIIGKPCKREVVVWNNKDSI